MLTRGTQASIWRRHIPWRRWVLASLALLLASGIVEYRYAQADDRRYTFVHHANEMQGGAVLKRDGMAYRTAVPSSAMIGTLVSGEAGSKESYTWWVCVYYVDSSPVFKPMHFVTTDGKVHVTEANGVEQGVSHYCNRVPSEVQGKYFGAQIPLKSGSIIVKTIYGLP